MGLAPDIILDLDNQTEVETSKTYKIDFENGRISGMVDGLDAVKQTIIQILLTTRFAFIVHDEQYGIDDLIGLISSDLPDDYIFSEGERIIKESLSNDDRIISTSNYKFSHIGDELFISFDVETIFGDTSITHSVSS